MILETQQGFCDLAPSYIQPRPQTYVRTLSPPESWERGQPELWMFNSSEPCFISPEPCSIGLFIFQAGARNLGIDSLENQHTRQEGESDLCGRRVAKSHVTGGPFGLSIHIKIKCEILFQ